MRRLAAVAALSMMTILAGVSCGDPQPPINRLGPNIVEKSAFEGSWYMSRTVIDLEYEGAPLAFVGSNSGDPTSGIFGRGIPRVRWVIDENFLYAYRDYEIVSDPEDPFAIAGDEDEAFLGQPIAAFAIQSHFDIRRSYNATTGEEFNTIEENTTDRFWWERQFMRVDWSQNLITGYFGNSHNLAEVFGSVTRESASIFFQDQSEAPASWAPQFYFMSCDGVDDESETCAANDRDWALDYEPGELYSMSFVTQEIVTPRAFPGFGIVCNSGDFSERFFPGAPECASVAIAVRTSFLRVSDQREYVAEDWTLDRFNRAGYFNMDRPTFDETSEAGDPAYWLTDFTNQSTHRHNIWQRWYERDGAGDIVTDANGDPVLLPYADRGVRPIVWYLSSETPAHLVEPSFELVGEWNDVFMRTVRDLTGRAQPDYGEVACQNNDPGAYCYCQVDPVEGVILNPTCAGRYDPFETPEEATARGVVDPFDCWVEVPEGAEPDWAGEAANQVTDADFFGWFGAETRGSECVNVLRNNTCHFGNEADWENLDCQERGDVRFKLLSYVDQPGTPFLGVAQLRGDPITGEMIYGDANIGGPAMNSQRTRALQTYDLLAGNITDRDFFIGEDVLDSLEARNSVDLPAPPRIDFNVAETIGVNGDPVFRAGMERTMERAYARALELEGPVGRTRTYADRLREFAGTDLEAQLLSSPEFAAMTGYEYLPNQGDMHMLADQHSPFRTDFRQQIEAFDGPEGLETRLGLANMMMPNEYVDASVLAYVQDHQDWPRARVEFELNRRLYLNTQIHEMGHCLGLRHDFSGTADVNNYYDGYYTINEAIPLPDPNEFNIDGVAGLSPDEQRRFEDAYDAQRERRELAGIDQWMNASIMDYTPQWYQRISGAARHDRMAVSFGYGDIVDIYRNDALRPVEQIHPANTERVSIKWYPGGETCTADAECPFSATGSRAGELLQSNLDSGLTQRCVPSVNVGSVCSRFEDDQRELLQAAQDTPQPWVPVEYFYCDDIRSSTRSLPGCTTFDEGDSFREIVRNALEAYDRNYIFDNFRRYRRRFGRTFNGGARYAMPMINIFTNLMYRYAAEPEFRNQEGPFGFADQFLATADIMNMLAVFMNQPSVGTYQWDSFWERYERVSSVPNQGGNFSLDVDQGRHLFSVYQSGLTGINRIERVGSFSETFLGMQLLTLRGLGPFYGADVVFQTNYYDLFPNEMNQIFTGLIANRPEASRPRVLCGAGSAGRDCDNPRILFMDFYRGDCSDGSDSPTCRPSPEENYADLPVVNGQSSIQLRNIATILALAFFPIYSDTTFQNQMFICVAGRPNCTVPAEGAVEGEDYAVYTSRRFTQSYLAWQVAPDQGNFEQQSIAFAMVKEARDGDLLMQALRAYRGDFGGPPLDEANIEAFLTPEQFTNYQAIDYELPDNSADVNDAFNSLESRVRSLESFFNLVIQIQSQSGIVFPQLFARPEF
jgi:hypothetical protein